MKKMKMLIIILFFVVFIGGCSCTQSMCTGEDMEKIKTSIREKWENNDKYIDKLEQEAASKDITSSTEVENYVKQHLEEKIESEYNSHPKACLTTVDMVDPDSGATISGKTWGSAFKEGLLEGLIVFPISWLLISFTSLFGGSGFAKVMAIVIATILIKLAMLTLTFKQQVQTQKLQAIQPELTELNKKISDPSLSQQERYRLQLKMMDIYKKNNINPLASLIPTLISFPIFLSVWSAVSQTLVIRTGEFLGIELGKAVSNQVFGFNIGAIILFLLMSVLQILSMKMPTIIRKKYASEEEKYQIDNSNDQMKTMMRVMIIMIIFTGFMLPSALAIYWAVGALFSILQTIVLSHPVVKQKLSGLGNRKKKAKVVQ